MALVQRNNPVGVDNVIDALQQYIYTNLIGAGWTDYECYARANKNQKGDNVIPEVSTDPKNYKEVLFNDKFNATSFFLVADSPDVLYNEGLVVHDVSIIWQVRLDKIYPSITTHRPDEELHVLLTDLLNNTSLIVELDNYQIGVDNVYSDVSIGDFGEGNEYLDDLGEFHVVKYNFKVKYDVTSCSLNYSPACDPASLRVNGAPLTTISAGATFDLPVVNTDDVAVGTVGGGQVTIEDVNWTDSDGSPQTTVYGNPIVCTSATAAGATGGIYKSGADTSYFSGDEGDDPPGIGTDFFNMGFNNSFGHTYRFTGTTGGYTDGVSYFDVNGVATTKALAFPNDIMLVWSTYNQNADNVLAVRFNPLASDSVNDHLASQPYTYDSKNDWKLITLTELTHISKTDTNADGWLDYLPVERVYVNSSDRLWTRTPTDISNYYMFWTGLFFSRTSYTTSYETFVTRLYTLTELGL